MNYPLISEYIEAIKSAEDNFDELSCFRPILNDDGTPVMSVGGFSVVFKMKDERDGKLYAVKCFTKDQEGRAESYKLIADELEFVSSNYLIPVRYLEKELFVDTEQTDEEEFPVLIMDWVEGKTLDTFIKDNINNQYALEMLAYKFNKMASWLLTQQFAHGDLKPDNILVKDDGALVLIDYDGMYVPAMKGQKARENGSPGYRHPQRTVNIFDEHIDDFSIATISLSLKAISINSALYSEMGGNDRLLFSEKDFQEIGRSNCISSVQSLLGNEELCTLCGVFLIALAKNSLSDISYRLLEIEKSQKEDLQKAVASYLEAIAFVKNKEYEKAFHIFSSLARKGKKSGMLGNNGLGYMYANGMFVIRDNEKAFSCFKRAADQGWSMSQFNLGICFEKGIGVKKSSKEANRLFHMAAEQNFGPALDLESWEFFPYTSAKVEAAANIDRQKELTSKFFI